MDFTLANLRLDTPDDEHKVNMKEEQDLLALAVEDSELYFGRFVEAAREVREHSSNLRDLRAGELINLKERHAGD